MEKLRNKKMSWWPDLVEPLYAAAETGGETSAEWNVALASCKLQVTAHMQSGLKNTFRIKTNIYSDEHPFSSPSSQYTLVDPTVFSTVLFNYLKQVCH